MTQGTVISTKQILLLLAPAALRIVSRPSVTATVELPSIHRVDDEGVPLAVSTPLDRGPKHADRACLECAG